MYWPEEEDEVASFVSTFSVCSLTVLTLFVVVDVESKFGAELNKGAEYPPAEAAPVVSLVSSLCFVFVPNIELKKSLSCSGSFKNSFIFFLFSLTENLELFIIL